VGYNYSVARQERPECGETEGGGGRGGQNGGKKARGGTPINRGEKNNLELGKRVRGEDPSVVTGSRMGSAVVGGAGGAGWGTEAIKGGFGGRGQKRGGIGNKGGSKSRKKVWKVIGETLAAIKKRVKKGFLPKPKHDGQFRRPRVQSRTIVYEGKAVERQRPVLREGGRKTMGGK